MKIRILFLSFVLLLIMPLCVNAEAINVSDYNELKEAITNSESEIVIKEDITYDSLITISYEVTINGDNHKLIRGSGYTGGLLSITSNGNVTINNLNVDGGAPNWEMDIANGANNSSGYFRVDVINTDGDILATDPLIINAGVLNIKSSIFENVRNNNGTTAGTGGVIRTTAGTVTIEDGTFRHCASYREGGVLYASGGDVTIKDSKFINNASGAGYKGQTHGGAIQVNGANKLDVDNTLFQDNFAQHNGGAIMLQTNGSDIKITNSVFKHNMCGNDGAAVSLESGNAKHKIEITDTLFEENKGLATTGQSMGTLWLDSWKNDENMAAEFRNLTFKNNHTANGSAFATYGLNSPYCILDNIETSENKSNGVGVYFLQSGTFLISNANIHDNMAGSGAGVVTVGGTAVVTDSVIKNNTAVSRGGGGLAAFGSLTIKNSEITNNHSNNFGGGIAAYSMYPNYGNPELHLENVLVKDNTADGMGGGISIQDTGSAHSVVTADEDSRIYDNHAEVAADDVLYTHANSTAGANTTLVNMGIAGILGIDGWYNDNEGDRFLDTDNPTTFEDYVDNDGSVAFYIKAAGLSNASYDGNGGTTDALPVTIRYGETYIVDDDTPVRDGYEFEGWNTKPDGTGTLLKAGDPYDGKEGLVLYAMWIVKAPESINPETSDKIMIFFIILIISGLSLVGLTIYNKKLMHEI